MRHLLLAAAVIAVFLVVLTTAGATATGAQPLVLSPRAIDFGGPLHAGQKGTAYVTVSNPGNLPRLLRSTSVRDTANGCRSFGRTCPVRIVSESAGCPPSGPLGAGQQCQVALAFAPASPGDLDVSLCIDSLGPMGGTTPPTEANSCIPVTAHVLSASTEPRTPAPTGTAPAQPGATTPPTTPPKTKPTGPTASAPPRGTVPVPPPLPLAWQSAGGFIWHTAAVDPTVLGQEMRGNGFGWVAIRLNDGLSADRVDASWIARFRKASGLPVGGWGVLRDQPGQEAQLAATLVGRLGLDFYIADAEVEYEYSNQSGTSAQRFGRSATFVREFRTQEPFLPAALSSYCRADMHDIDWAAWRSGGFDFMPQAYVDQFGSPAAPAACAAGAAGIFSPDHVHPTVGTFPSSHAVPSPAAYGRMLKAAGAVGFSVYLAETLPGASWKAYGQAIADLGIAG